MIKKISGHAYSSRITNLSEITMSASSSIISRIAFGKKYEDEGSEKSKFHGLLNETQAIFLSFFVSDYIPFLGWVDKLTGSLARVENTFKALDEFFEDVVNEHLNPNRQKETQEEDIVDVLLELKKQGRLSIDLTNDHIKAVIMVCVPCFSIHFILSYTSFIVIKWTLCWNIVCCLLLFICKVLQISFMLRKLKLVGYRITAFTT